MYRYIGWDYPLNKTASLVDAQPLGLAARKILCCAEQLIAEHGLEGVSTRMISRASGQKNNSALQYHFKNREGLIEAILDYRVTPVNQQRLLRLQHLKSQSRLPSTRKLVEVFIEPFASELLKPIEDTYYVSLLAQLYAYQAGRELFSKNKVRARALHDITSLLIKTLAPLPVRVIHLRLQLMGRQTVSSVAEWDEARRKHIIELDSEALQWRTRNLIDFMVAGLQAPSTDSARHGTHER